MSTTASRERTRGKGSSTPRDRGKFIKGVSGNPSGRPKIPEGVVELARQNTTLAVATLVDVCRNKHANAGARVLAAGVLLDRAWGKALARTETRNVNIDLTKLSDAQLLAMLQEVAPGAVSILPPPETDASLETSLDHEPILDLEPST